MNKFILIAALVAVAAADDVFGGGRSGFFGRNGGRRGNFFDDGSDDPFGESIFAQDRVKSGDRAAVSVAERVKASDNEKARDRDSAKIAAEKKDAARVAAKNKFAEEDYINKANHDSVKFQNDVSKAKNFQVHIVDQAKHDESTKFAADNKSAFKAGSRKAAQNDFAAEAHNSDRFKAAADREGLHERDSFFGKENLFDGKQENIFESDNRFESEFFN